MKRQDTRLQVEEMESRVVPSVVETLPLASPPLSAAAQSPQPFADHSLGTLQGSYSLLARQGVDAGVAVSFHGSGPFAFLGDVNLTGTLHGTGDIPSGHANGDITLTNGRGSLTLDLVGPVQGKFAGLPDQYQFSVVSATGAFKGFQVSGNVELLHNPTKHTFKMTFETAQKVHDANALAGKGSGSFNVQTLIPDTGLTDHLTGTGNVGLLGQVKITGWVQGVGMIRMGEATGQLTLSNAAGSVTLKLTGPQQAGFSALPTVFQFTVVGATGAYTGMKDTGSIDLKFDPIEWMHADSNPKLPIVWEGGTFQMTINPKAI